MYQACGGRAFSLLGPDAIHDQTDGWFYVRAPGIDEPLLAIKRVPTTFAMQARLQIVSDGQGQLVAIADSSGGFNNVFAGPDHYTPGTWATAGMTTHAQTFDPERLSADSGAISSFRARQYDPATGKWLQEDPSGIAGGVNLYEYNGNDPNSFGDPFGLQALKCPDCPRHPDPGEIRPVSIANDPILGLLTAGTGRVESAAVEGAEEVTAFGSRVLGRIVTEGEDVTSSRSSVTNLRHPMPTSELQNGLRTEGFAETIRGGGKSTFSNDATNVRVTTYIDRSYKGPAADVLFNNTRVLKIRLGPEP